MSSIQKWRLFGFYAAVIGAALIMVWFEIGGMLPNLMIMGVVSGLIHLCLITFKLSDLTVGTGNSDPTPPEPDYVRTGSGRRD